MKTSIRFSFAAHSFGWLSSVAWVTYLGVVSGAVFAQVRSVPASQPPPIPPPTVEDVPVLLEQLGHPSYRIRSFATEQLKRLPRDVLTSPLAKHYKTTKDYEVKLLIKEIAQTVYLMEHEEGFLGVGLDPRRITQKEAPRLPENTIGIRITLVLKGTAASIAGLKTGDIIIACNGKPLPPGTAQDASKEFRKLIASFRPRMPLTLELLRGERTSRVSLKLGTRPEQYWNSLDKLSKIEKIDKDMRSWWRKTFESNPDKTITRPGDDTPPSPTPPSPTPPSPTPPPLTPSLPGSP